MSSEPLRYDEAPTRRDRILSALQERGFTSVTDLAEALGVSGMTVRRDLRRLEELGEVRVVHGGASLRHPTFRSAFVARAAIDAAGKSLIAQHAVKLVGDREPIAIDAGTTAYEVAASLPNSYAGTLVTHSVPVVQHMLGRPEVRLICLGGELLAESHAFIGPMTVEAAERLRVQTLFLGAAAVDRRGVYVEADAERPTKRALMEAAARVVLVADHMKFGATAPVLLCPISKVTTVITDADVPQEIERVIADAGGEVIVAKPPA
jgi:DeoR family transcriptional regulator, fructose operon transcriptional repressor